MELYVFDKNRVRIGIVEAFEYLRWTRRYSRCGSFEMKAVAIDENLDLLRIGNFIWKDDDEEAGLIEFVELTMLEQEFILISGRFATGFLARRIIWGTEILSGDLGTAAGKLLTAHLIAPSNPARKIDKIAYTPITLGVTVNTQISHRNLMEVITDLFDAADAGIKTVFVPEAGTFTIVPYWGTDSQAVFSKEYENIIEQIFTQSIVDYASIALVGGEGEGAGRTFVTVGGGEGEDRHETFVDARDLQRESFSDDYEEALGFRGLQRLAEHAFVEAFDAGVNLHGNLTYKVDFDIGSKIKAVSKRWGIHVSARITEIEESYDREGMSIAVTFGKPLLTLAQKLKRGDI